MCVRADLHKTVAAATAAVWPKLTYGKVYATRAGPPSPPPQPLPRYLNFIQMSRRGRVMYVWANIMRPYRVCRGSPLSDEPGTKITGKAQRISDGVFLAETARRTGAWRRM